MFLSPVAMGIRLFNHIFFICMSKVYLKTALSYCGYPCDVISLVQLILTTLYVKQDENVHHCADSFLQH